jgi:hypothetical protein
MNVCLGSGQVEEAGVKMGHTKIRRPASGHEMLSDVQNDVFPPRENLLGGLSTLPHHSKNPTPRHRPRHGGLRPASSFPPRGRAPPATLHASLTGHQGAAAHPRACPRAPPRRRRLHRARRHRGRRLRGRSLCCGASPPPGLGLYRAARLRCSVLR